MRSLGDRFESRAAQWLQSQGVRLVMQNFASKCGEIDIIALDGDCLVFVEVRARSHPGFASAAASVDRRKQQRIMRTAQLFLQRRPELAELACRFDVVAFEPPQSGTGMEVHWIRAAFTA